jgi:hypothetical protein
MQLCMYVSVSFYACIHASEFWHDFICVYAYTHQMIARVQAIHSPEDYKSTAILSTFTLIRLTLPSQTETSLPGALAGKIDSWQHRHLLFLLLRAACMTSQGYFAPKIRHESSHPRSLCQHVQTYVHVYCTNARACVHGCVRSCTNIMNTVHAATCKKMRIFKGFDSSLYEITTGSPSRWHPIILQVAV